jgi:hypothetical protein
MRRRMGVTRRSFVGRVTGGVMLSGSSMILLASDAGAFQTTGCSDSDPTDPGGNGRHCTPAGPLSGCSDQDPGDPSGRGRHCTGQTGNPCTDRDPTDSTGRGRNCGGGAVQPPAPPTPPGDTSGYRGNVNATGCSDSDGGANYDRSGYGRNCQVRTGGNQNATGCSDSDTGPNMDRAGFGTHCITGNNGGGRQQGGDDMPQIMAALECDRGVPLPINISELPSQNCHIVITNWRRNTAAPVVVSLPQALDFAGNHANGIQVIGAGQQQVFNWDNPERWGLFVFACPAQRGTGANCGRSVTNPGSWSIPINITQQGARGTTVMLTGDAFPHP